MIRRLICVLMSYCAVITIMSQESSVKEYPVINEMTPEFTLTNVEGLLKENIRISDLRGKPVIIDFFSRGCTGCFASFPKISAFREQYKDKLEIIIVGLVSSQKSYMETQKIYNAYAKKYNLNLPVSYDSILSSQFRIQGVPHVIWIDKNGIVKAVTNEISKANIAAFAEGNEFTFTDLSVDTRPKDSIIDFQKPISVQPTDTNFIQRSLLARWRSGMPILNSYSDIASFIEMNTPLQVAPVQAAGLYRMAYFGTLTDWVPSDLAHYANERYSPILELSDSSIFNKDNFYTYSLIASSTRIPDMQAILQRDLANFFGYNVTMETRSMPYLRLVIDEKSKVDIRSKGGSIKKEHSYVGLNLQNMSVERLLEIISYDAYLVSKDLPIIDETGLKGNIDIKFTAIMTDWKDIQKGLNGTGLKIVEGFRDMKCIVIREPVR